MKHFILALVALVQLSCATQNSSSNEDKSIKKIILSDEPVYVENKTIDEPIDFTSYFETHQISEGVYQVDIKSGVTFKKCVFKKPVSAFRKMDNGSIVLTSFQGNVTFIDCFFEEDVNFRGSSINGRIDFTGTTFDKSANFEELNCHENAFFNKCIFEGSLRFQNAFFNQKANFMSAEFYDSTSFQNSLFNSELQFSAAKFFKYTDFALIDCRGKVLFNYTEFRYKADFSHSIFVQDFDFVNTKNHTTSFNNCRFLGKVRFNNLEVISAFSLKDSYFMLDTPKIDIDSEKLMFSK
ncbi:pentapeptide repeat-containing protein [Winogradskyella schleiferi]|uniref:pentapeptide repeat-containing protein n=1 Tax=Winogradskyella schleiferi TaxID=2686078 RepID=UPI0015BC36DB|nr:pentapeptide repeat-containing protein [Winogradskyella schleiferi]